MEQYLMDTNVVSDYLSASLPTLGIALMDGAIDNVPNISIITQIELLCWNTDKSTTENVTNFIADSHVLEISPEVITQCVMLRKSKKIKIPDAIIAATAIVYKLTLITRNISDFKNISGLIMIDPYNMLKK
ncbi:MAG: type II toxin-antitoxin system VapC family toxin [Saprospiraceae bacterium]|nr:type II toxin-antitoxin system VapC family toxin [Candidatus Defluviibacterium haderslevense]